jgi:hypothetical protein
MEDSQPEQELSEAEELKELISAETQVLEFLGECYVSVSGFHAAEEFLCEQYAASRRFLVRCFSESSSLYNTEPLTTRYTAWNHKFSTVQSYCFSN